MKYNRQFSSYYQAQVKPSQTWYFVAILRSFEHMVFDRTFNVTQGIFEFFVPPDTEKYFLQVIFNV